MALAMARHILVKTSQEADKLKQRLASGEDFAALAKAHSLCPSGRKGGDLGEIRPGQMVRAFDEVVFKRPLKQIHGPLRTPFGYHLVQVYFRS